MATDSPSLPPALDDARQQAGRLWQARAPRERQLIVVMAIATRNAEGNLVPRKLPEDVNIIVHVVTREECGTSAS